MFDPIVAYLFESSNLLAQEVQYIRAEMHEEEQRIDREQIEAEEQEALYREWQRTHLDLWGEIPTPQPVTRKCVQVGGVQ